VFSSDWPVLVTLAGILNFSPVGVLLPSALARNALWSCSFLSAATK
jgi:hypothetical protein